MSDRERERTVGPVTHNLDKILDAHTHLSGPQSGESAENILECMDACGVEKAFIFAPELDVQIRLLTNEHLQDIRTHNDYCADICSKAPERLLGFFATSIPPGSLRAATSSTRWTSRSRRLIAATTSWV